MLSSSEGCAACVRGGDAVLGACVIAVADVAN